MEYGKAIRKLGQVIPAALLFLHTSPLFSSGPSKERTRFCVQDSGSPKIQTYAPLVDPQKRTAYTKAVFTADPAGSWLQHVQVRTFDPSSSLTYDYKFTREGKLSALHGMLEHWGHWYAEADLFPPEDGSPPPYQVIYRKNAHSGEMSDPEDGPGYTNVFRTVPVFRTLLDTPCAAQFLEAEK